MTEIDRDAAVLGGNAFHDLTAVLTEAAKQLTAAAEKMKADGGRVAFPESYSEAHQEMVAQVVREAIGSVRWFGHELLVTCKAHTTAADWVALEVLDRRMNKVLGQPKLSARAEEYLIGQQADQ